MDGEWCSDLTKTDEHDLQSELQQLERKMRLDGEILPRSNESDRPRTPHIIRRNRGLGMTDLDDGLVVPGIVAAAGGEQKRRGIWRNSSSPAERRDVPRRRSRRSDAQGRLPRPRGRAGRRAARVRCRARGIYRRTQRGWCFRRAARMVWPAAWLRQRGRGATLGMVRDDVRVQLGVW